MHNKIHQPYQVLRIRAQKRKPFGRQPFTESSAFYAQSIKVVNAVYPLVIDVKVIPTQQLPDAPITKTSAFKRQLNNTP
ncbi:hypothetical protein NB716_000916 [Pantoea ananatis]|nr:hypothetical protein [Pantoea ananatis]